MTVGALKPKPRILFVDDQRLNLNLFEAYLLPHGYDPLLATAADRSWQEHGVSDSVTVSIGAGSYLNYADSKEQIMCLADSALYRAKRAGRNQVVVNPVSGFS